MPWGVSKRMIDSVFVHHRFLHIWDRCPEREGSAVVNSFPLKTVECWVREGHSAAKAKIWTFFLGWGKQPLVEEGGTDRGRWLGSVKSSYSP